jgi:hypothetical protein
MSYRTRKKQKSEIDLQADLYSAIATMDKLATHFDRGMVEEVNYRKQLQSSINDVFKTQMALEEHGFKMDDFISRHQLKDKFPAGVQRLNLVQGEDSSQNILSFTGVKALPAKSADFVANAIELIDILRLKSISRVELLVPPLDEMFKILSEFPNFGESHWVTTELNGWRKALLDESPSTLLEEEDMERLEFEASRWLNEFRGELKKIG